ncbi:Metallo-dependent phosphatase-like protein [Tricladium varicosporioides]|nr:Metallo-dependent phosphatase-like protein [Hymenoscyphus varicosporioides]
MSSLFTLRTDDSHSSIKRPILQLHHGTTFHISIFSDLHYGEEENGWGIDQDVNSTRVMNNILSREKPDFVVLNGDLITGENTFLENSTHYMDVIASTLEQHNIPWASTYGNHDSQFNLSREALFTQEHKHLLSYTQHSPSGIPGITNYYLPIYPANSSIPIAILYFFDSQGGSAFQDSSKAHVIPNWVEPATVSWFTNTRSALKEKYGRDLPSIAFVHIPPTAFLAVQQSILPKFGQKSSHFPGLNEDVPLAPQGSGQQDIPFMQALVSTPNLHSIYSGHDHGDAWCGNWPTIKGVDESVSKPHVCFCKHTGYGGYGNWKRGARNVMLRFDEGGRMEVETWVRMEGGEVVQRVDLNGTYGIDRYNVDDGE